MKKFKINIQLFAEPGEVKTFTQEEVDKMIETRLKRENEKFEKAKKELERQHNESIEDYEERIKNANLTAEEKHKKELDRISGANEEEIEASVKGFAETMGEYVKSLGASGVPGAMNGGSNGGADKKVQLEDLRKKAFESGSDIDRANYVRAKQELENSGGNE